MAFCEYHYFSPALSRETLQAEVFGYDEPVGPNAIEVNITRVRGKLAPDGPAIRTVRGVGYVLG